MHCYMQLSPPAQRDYKNSLAFACAAYSIQLLVFLYRQRLSNSAMASGAVQKRVEVTNGLDLIWESRVLYADILFSFRECHDVCLHSQLFSSDIILKIDQCAVDFRQLSFDTVTIAKRVSNQWLDVAITFFENIDQADDPKEMLKLLGDQARELARCFKLIAAWARNLAGRFHAAQDGTIKEAEVFKQAFEAAHTEAESVRQQAQEELDKASKTRAKHASSESGWKHAQIWLSWCPIAHVVTGPGAHAAKKKHAKSAELEAEAREKLRKTQQQLEEKRSQHEKAKVHIHYN